MTVCASSRRVPAKSLMISRVRHDLLVGQEPPARIVERRATEQRQAGVAVVVNFLHVVVELVAHQRGRPPRASGSSARPRIPLDPGSWRDRSRPARNGSGRRRRTARPGPGCGPAAARARVPPLAATWNTLPPWISFIAMNAAAMPQPVCMNCRRLSPSRLLLASANSRIRRSTRFCVSLCGGGRYSPFDTIWVGIGVAAEAVSAPATRRCSRSLSQLLIVASLASGC